MSNQKKPYLERKMHSNFFPVCTDFELNLVLEQLQ